MKRKDLTKTLAQLAKANGVEFTFVRNGGSHDVWTFNGANIAIPRHNEVNEMTARTIIKTARGAI